MELVFLGTPRFAVPTLEKLVGAHHRVPCVVTQPDRPKGRGREPAASPVKEAALRLGIPVYQPQRIRGQEVLDRLRDLNPEIGVVVGYGKIIPQSVIDLPRHGIVNLHASLLPKYRGAAPIQWAVVNGETRTGVSTMRIDAGLDTGDILLQWETEISPDETAVDLGVRLARAGADLVLATLEGLQAGSITPRPQDHGEATHARILEKEDGWIDWTIPAAAIHNRVRGLQPWPGTYTRFRGRILHIWKTLVIDAGKHLEPGELWGQEGLAAGCGNGTALRLLELQLEGKRKLAGEDFANGQRLTENEFLGEARS